MGRHSERAVQVCASIRIFVLTNHLCQTSRHSKPDEKATLMKHAVTVIEKLRLEKGLYFSVFPFVVTVCNIS